MNLNVIFSLVNNPSFNVNAKSTENGATPLITAAIRGYTKMMTKLLDSGARIDDRDSRLSTALHYAVWISKPDAAKLLIERGADINALNSMLDTPLNIAASIGSYEMIEILLEVDPLTLTILIWLVKRLFTLPLNALIHLGKLLKCS